MIRQINLMNGFFDQNTKNLSYYSADTYPNQETDKIGKWTRLRYINEANGRQSYYKYMANGIECLDRNGEYFFIGSDKKVPKVDQFGKPIKVEKILVNPNINNRFRLSTRDYKNLTATNSGEETYFQILRYDSKDNKADNNHKVILRAESGEVIVLTVEEFEDIYDLIDSDSLRRATAGSKVLGDQSSPNTPVYVSPNTTSDIDFFIDKYNHEKVNEYPIQDEELLGLNVYSEYQGDLKYTDSFDKEMYMKKHGKYYYKEDNTLADTKGPKKHRKNRITPHSEGDLFTKDYKFNRMSKKEYTTDDGDPLILHNGRYYYYDKFFGDNDPRNEEYVGIVNRTNANKFKITPRILHKIRTTDPDSKGLANELLASYPYYHNTYAESINNLPRRAHNIGVIIRADLNASGAGQVVVMERDDSGLLRFVCQDEARFYYDTLNKSYTKSYTTIHKLI